MAVAPQQPDRPRVSRLLDIRTVIGALLGVYGVVLLAAGLVGGSESSGRRAGDAANLWVGLALVVAAAGFLAWVRFRPVVPEEAEPAPAEDERAVP